MPFIKWSSDRRMEIFRDSQKECLPEKAKDLIGQSQRLLMIKLNKKLNLKLFAVLHLISP